MQEHFSRRSLAFVLVAMLLACCATTALGQTSRGTVSGTVADATGAMVPNAQVILTGVATNISRQTTTNSAGLYRFDAVDLGVYKMEVSAQGFQSIVVTGIEVRANQTSAQDFSLKVGTMSESVEVTAGAAAVALQTDEQLRGANIDTKRVMQLPISNQNSLNLMLTVPGVVPRGTTAGGGIGSVNGSRSRANKFLIDGADNNDVSVAGQVITMTNNDAIQEVSIQTANFSAEFGRSGGAIVNQITKSGTNALHGTAAWVYRSEVFNASTQTQRISYFGKLANWQRDPVNNAKPTYVKPAFKEHIPAFTAGGPVYIPHVYDGRNKTFWFVGGQWDHYNAGATLTQFTIPTAAGISTLQSLAPACPNAALYLKALSGMVADNKTGSVNLAIPATVYTQSGSCNGTNRAGMSLDYGSGVRVIPNNSPSYNVQVRVDHAISSRQNLMLRVYEDYSTSPNYFVGLSRPFDADATFREVNAAIAHTLSISNTITNELRLNFTRPSYVWTVVDSTGLGALPIFNFGTSGLSSFGTSTNYPQGRTPNTYQIQDVVTKVAGHHQFRMGAELFRQITRQLAPSNTRGTLNYAESGSGSTLVSDFANFLDDWSGPGNGRASRLFGNPVYHPSYTATSSFFQDSWKITPELTLNLGIRYDYFGQPVNIFTYPLNSMDATGFTTAKLKADKNNFGPSLGFAWNPKQGFLVGEGKTVIRGGFQISYDTSFNNLLSNIAGAAPNNPANDPPVNASSTSASTSCPLCRLRGLPSLYAARFPAMAPGYNVLTNTSSQFTNRTRTPYTERWSFGFQREMPFGIVMDLSYVGAVGHKLYQTLELNPNGPPVYTAPAAGSAPGTLGTYTLGNRVNSALGSRQPRDTTANSNYNSLQLSVNKRYGNTPVGALVFSSAYTWSKSLGVIEDVFGSNASGSLMSANPVLYNGWRTSDYGPLDSDRRHNWVSSVVWELPSPKMRFVSQVLGGWSVSGVIPVRSGVPLTVYNGIDRDLDGTANQDRPDIGNPRAPINTMAKMVGTNVCSTGWQSVYNAGCVNPTDVRWLSYPTGTFNKTTLGKTAGHNSLYSKGGSVTADVSIIKKFNIHESRALEYRAEIFNLANTMNYDFVPRNTSLSSIFGSVRNGVPTTTFMDYSQSNAGNRTMRMQLKFIF